MLIVDRVSKSYPGRPPRVVVRDVELSLRSGEYVAIMGESGVGKSTLLNLIAGLEWPDSGSIVLDGQALAGLDDDAATLLRRRAMGFVFQAFHLLPHLTVAQNVSLPLRLNAVDADGVRTRVDEMLAKVGLTGRGASLPRELSGGELQRVAIARALVHRPALLLADEPTGNLDANSADQVLALLRDAVKAGGASGILVTHSPRAAATADRVLLMTPQGLASRDPQPAVAGGGG